MYCSIYKSVNLHWCILSFELKLELLKALVFTNLIRNAEKSMSCPDMARHVCWCTTQLFYFPQPAAGLWIMHRGEHLFLAQASRRGYSHFKITANLCVICLFKFICIQCVSHMASDFYANVIFHIVVASITSLITGTQYKTSLYLHHCEIYNQLHIFEHWILLNINIRSLQVSYVLFFC